MFNQSRNERFKCILSIMEIILFGIMCFSIGVFFGKKVFPKEYTSSNYSYDVFSSVTFEGAVQTNDMPWNYTAGMFDMDEGECILLTPNTAVNLEEFDTFNTWSFQYKIHPWVCNESDGAGLTIWILDENENILYSDKMPVNNMDDWQLYSIDLSIYDRASKIKILCDNGFADNDECDWVIIKAQSNKSQSFADNYVRSATYFSDEWPVNFWNSEMDHLEKELDQIKEDGFDSIIIIIPWREFQPTILPVSYNEYAFSSLDRVMTEAGNAGLKVYARIGYTWDFYGDEDENIVDRYFNLLGDEETLTAWDAYVTKLYNTLSSYECFAGAFLTWEDFWNSFGICDVNDLNERTSKAKCIKYGEWVSQHYSLKEYNELYQTNYMSYDQIPVPHRSDPALWAMYEFYDDFLINLLKRSQQYFPNLSMEVRMDWDLVMDKTGTPVYYKHNETFDCLNSDFSATMYGIPMGFENVGEHVTYKEALEKTKYILENFKAENGGKAVYIDQFIYADNTPAFSNNAQIYKDELNDYLLNVGEILLNYSEGYGIWTYRNYCANMLYNPQFALEGSGWGSQSITFYNDNGSMVCHITPTDCLSQKISDVRNHFNADTYIFEFDVVDCALPGIIEIQIGDTIQETEISSPGKVQLIMDSPAYFDLKLSSVDADITIDNLKLYCQIQQGYLYDDELNELECIDAIRVLNDLLSIE